MSGIIHVFNKAWSIGRFKINFCWRSRKSSMGRFGGGWNWHVGVQWSGTTAILFFLVCYLRISWSKK